MQTAIMNAQSEADIKLLAEIARKMGMDVKILAKSEVEDIGLALAIKKGRSGTFVDTKKFKKSLSRES